MDVLPVLRADRMEPLSPKSINIQFKSKAAKEQNRKDMEAEEAKKEEAKKAEAARRAQKEKEYAPPPPDWIIQPPLMRGGLSEKFKTGRLLGKGGFAIAYEGELRSKKSNADKQIFALKIVKAKMSLKKMEEKFRTELQIHAKMQHPNIVEFHRAFTYHESTYVVLELCSNGSVMDMVKKRKCLTLPEVRRLMVQLCGAIKYMHARCVIHRDLKMGNLFLDHNMNLKIGDFGLAAVLVSKDEYDGLFNYAKSRRTTLCGTPNYIAPEILEKGKGGHDHKVDIWAMGVILFAMISGQPPFQSSSQSEIYKKARNVDYAWPAATRCSNDIPEEAKDLVSRLLRVEAEERPNPDEVVSHAFFAMHGGNAIPAVLEEHAKREIPSFLDQERLPRGDAFKADVAQSTLADFCRECGVGFSHTDQCLYPAVGADMEVSLYRECAIEEAAGNSPIMPLPSDSVYTSRYSSIRYERNSGTTAQEDCPLATHSQPSANDAAGLIRPDKVDDAPVEKPRRRQMQSHAATLRAAHAPAKLQASTIQTQKSATSTRASAIQTSLAAGLAERRGLLNELPVRPNRMTQRQGEYGSAEEPRATRSRKTYAMNRVVANTRTQPAPRTNQIKTEEGLDSKSKTRESAIQTQARIAATVQTEMINEPVKAKLSEPEAKQDTEHRGLAQGQTIESSGPLIEHSEATQYMANSRPDQVLASLRKLHRQLQSSLRTIGQNKSSPDPKDIEIKSRAYKDRPLVKVWVDYTNRFGIGYILTNGTVGCLFNANGNAPASCVIIPGAEAHVKRRRFGDYAHKVQIVPQDGRLVHFIENGSEYGLRSDYVQPDQYHVQLAATGTTVFSKSEVDSFDARKRKSIFLWNNFAQYMVRSIVQHAGNRPLEPEDSEMTKSPDDLCVTFYQNLGNVGIYGFAPVATPSRHLNPIHPLFQFNFPDHTKLVVFTSTCSRVTLATGLWIDFYYIGQSSGSIGTASSSSPPSSSPSRDNPPERTVLSYPLSVLLAGHYEDHIFSEELDRNAFTAKIGFIRDVVGVWIREGGLGCMGKKEKNQMMWQGAGEAKKKVWVSIGARDGDGEGRYVEKE